MLLILAILAEAALAACPTPSTSADIVSSIGAAESAFVLMDASAFRKAREDVRSLLPCLAEPLVPVDAAAIHRLNALDSFLSRDEDSTVTAFRAVVASVPSYQLPSTLALEGSTLRALYDTAVELGPGATDPLEPTEHFVLLLDGQRGLNVPQERPFIAQWTSTSGQVIWTDLVDAGDPLPSPSALVLQPDLPPEESGRRVNLPLLIAGGTAIIASGTLYGVSYSWRQSYDDVDDPDVATVADLEALRRKINAGVLASAGCGALGLGLGTVAFVHVSF